MSDITLKRRRAFTLVELIIVMAIMIVLTGAIVLGGSSQNTVDAFTEAGRLERSLISLRSAWIAAYSESGRQLGASNSDYEIYGPDSEIVAELSRYADRHIEDDIARYGEVRIIIQPNRAYIGFDGSWKMRLEPEARQGMKAHLASAKSRLYEISEADANISPNRYTSSSGDGILIRIR